MDTQEIPYQHSFTVAPDLAWRGTASTLTWQLRRGPLNRAFLIAFGAIAVTRLFGDHPGASTSYRIANALYGAGVFTVVFGALMTVILAMASFRHLRRALPVGSTIRTGFGQHSFVSATDWVTSRVSYAGVRSMATQGNFVIVQLRQGSATFYPRQVFPTEAIEHIQRLVDGAKAPSRRASTNAGG